MTTKKKRKGGSYRMKELITKMLNHPIATVVIVGAATSGIANIISAVKGNSIQPLVKIASTSELKDE